jgi:hypothetical protein
MEGDISGSMQIKGATKDNSSGISSWGQREPSDRSSTEKLDVPIHGNIESIDGPMADPILEEDSDFDDSEDGGSSPKKKQFEDDPFDPFFDTDPDELNSLNIDRIKTVPSMPSN